MRKLMWFVLGFGTASGICCRIWEMPWFGAWGAALTILAGILLLAGRDRIWIRRAAAILFGAAAGLCWFGAYRAVYLDTALHADSKSLDIIAQCSDYAYQTAYGSAVDGILTLEGKPYRTRFYLRGNPEITPGDHLKGQFRLRVTTPGGARLETYHPGKGIFLLAYQKDNAILAKAEKIPLQFYPVAMRHRLIEILSAAFPEDTAPFARALFLGDRSDIDYRTNTALKISGIMHIIAVSGLHVSILFALIYNLCLRRRILTATVGIFSLIFFAGMTGFTPSVTRACVMQILVIGALVLGKDYDPPTALSSACLLMLLVNPLVITSISFQLSVGAMAGIFLFQERISAWITLRWSIQKKGRKNRIKRWIGGSVSVTLSAMSLTTPLTALYFGTISLIGVLTNLLTLWMISLIFYGIMAVCAVGAVFPGGAVVLAQAISWLIRYVLLVSGILSRFPLAAVYTRSVYIVLWLLFVYLLLAVFAFSKQRKVGTLLYCGLISLLAALALSWLEPMTDRCRMTVLNVGQGQSIILQSEGKTYLVDCGGDRDETTADLIAETLISQGVSHLDGILLTHFDRDHVGALPYLLTRLRADLLLLPDAEGKEQVLFGLDQYENMKIVPVRENMELQYGHTKFTVAGPIGRDSGNESGLAVLFQAANCDILITGDRSDFGERMLMRQIQLPRLEILVAGHHGSRYSTCRELLEATRPQIAAISSGENSYGHPAPEVLERLQEFGCLVYRTDRDGDLIFRR